MFLKRIFKWVWDRDFDDIERLVKAFPSGLEEDVRAVAAILPFHERTFVFADGTVRQHDFFVTEYRTNDLQFRKETVRVPYRTYLNEPGHEEIKALSKRQRIILHCIYLRHNDGYVRQSHLERLIGETDTFICPFTIQLLGEYVVEILFVLETVITPFVIEGYARFLRCNRFYWEQTQSRMVSYWNEYYRRDYPHLKDYVGKRIVKRLNEAIGALED